MNLNTVEIKAFVPARDFELSQRFYQAVGFERRFADDDLAYFCAGDCSFLLQRFHVEDHTRNFVMHLLVENVAVLPEHQGQGHGKRLMAHAEAVATARGHAVVRLYTNQRFADNIKLSQTLDYVVEREETIPAGVVVHMRKRLP